MLDKGARVGPYHDSLRGPGEGDSRDLHVFVEWGFDLWETGSRVHSGDIHGVLESQKQRNLFCGDSPCGVALYTQAPPQA